MANSAESISLYNLADLKNTSDDAIPNYLNSLKFKQSHTLTDVRLALGYGAFTIAAACFLWDYKFGFEDTKYFTAVAVAVYTVLNGGLTLWMSEVEKGNIYQGTAPSGEKVNSNTLQSAAFANGPNFKQISIISSTKKFDPVYRLQVTVTSQSGETQTYEVNKHFKEWFDVAGRLIATPLQEILASSVPLIGKRDPKRVKMASQELLDGNPELLDAILAANNASGAAASTTAAEPAEKKAEKRRKA
ncbi:Signal peptidase complex subunit SPC2 [Paramyrothecium foliicola]|nr:Signal peptidase complex subunit SPC2 [Paramyrothecium foliicola]